MVTPDRKGERNWSVRSWTWSSRRSHPEGDRDYIEKVVRLPQPGNRRQLRDGGSHWAQGHEVMCLWEVKAPRGTGYALCSESLQPRAVAATWCRTARCRCARAHRRRVEFYGMCIYIGRAYKRKASWAFDRLDWIQSFTVRQLIHSSPFTPFRRRSYWLMTWLSEPWCQLVA